MKLLLTEEEVVSHLIKITAKKGHNFWSDHWIALKLLQEFLEIIFLGVAIELQLTEEEV
jgi:hypothetical protein